MNGSEKFAALDRVWKKAHEQLSQEARALSAARLGQDFFSTLSPRGRERVTAYLERRVEELTNEVDALAWALDKARSEYE